MEYPATQFNNTLITHLQTALSDDLEAGQIRGRLDVSGDDPRGIIGIVCSTVDSGSHSGTVGRQLIDLSTTITIYTHLDEDADGTNFEGIVEKVITALETFSPSVTGWEIHYIQAPQSTPVSMLESVFRTQDFNFVSYLEKTYIEEI